MSDTDFPVARFQAAGASPTLIAQLQAAWALLSPAAQLAENQRLESLSNYDLASITSLPVTGGAVTVPSLPSGQLIEIVECGSLSGAASGPSGTAGANTGAAVTVAAPTSYALWWGVVNANTVVTLPTPVQGQRFVMRLDQDTTGGRSVSWAGGTVEWPGAALALITTPSAENWISFECADGLKWQAFPITSATVDVIGLTLKATGSQGLAAGRFVGYTSGTGAPASGTWLTGDWTIDSTGTVYVCTTGGTPGTWAHGVTLDTTATDIQPLGTQAAGATGKAADAGHVHAMPRLDQVAAPTAAVALNSQKITGLANGTAATDAAAFGQVPALDATATDIQMDGTQAAGTTGKAADAGHVHPTDTSRAPLASPTFTGAPAAPTPAAGDSSTKLATTAFVAGSLTYGGLFGDGSDGAATLDGTTTVAWATLTNAGASGVYTMTRDCNLTSLTINSGITLVATGWRVKSQGAVTNAGTISANGGSAAGATAGAAATAGTVGVGQTGKVGATGVGSGGTGGVFGGNGGQGGSGGSGAGGGAGSAVITTAATAKNVLAFPQAAIVGTFLYTTTTRSFNGGSGGASGAGDGTNSGGGGGTGGSPVVIFAHTFTNTGTVSSTGGAGGTPPTGNCGGGGGGAGGCVVVYTLSAATMGTVTVTGGAAGSLVGTGANGTAGGAGLSLNVVLS